MCLSVVGNIISCDEFIAKVEIMGVEKQISVELIENPCVGESVLIHAGCAITKLSKQESSEIEEALKIYGESNEYQ